jgi:tellurite resistance protein
VASVAAAGLGWEGLARVLFGVSAVAAVVIWGASAIQFPRERVPAPLRPVLAIHLAPAAFLGIAAMELRYMVAAQGFAVLAALLLAALAGASRWLTAGGYSALWAAFTFPLAATAVLWLRLGGVWEYCGIAALIAATLIVVPIAVKVLRAWIDGTLATRTNAATA